MIETRYDWQIMQCIGSMASGVVWLALAWIGMQIHNHLGGGHSWVYSAGVVWLLGARNIWHGEMIYPPVLSFGAGVNSTALAILLINEGWRGHIVMSDTGCEWPDTYCFMDYFEREWLKPRGCEIVRLGGEWRRGYYKQYSLIDVCFAKGNLPLAKHRWCTYHYKLQPMQHWCKAHGLVNDEDAMVGIAADEAWRMGTKHRPLVDRGIDRDGCVRIIQAEGLDVPRKSGCYICPFQRDSQWRELWQRYPDLFRRGEELEIVMQERRRRCTTLDVSGRTTLAMRRLRYESQMPLLDPADMDELLEYRPCVCQL